MLAAICGDILTWCCVWIEQFRSTISYKLNERANLTRRVQLILTVLKIHKSKHASIATGSWETHWTEQFGLKPVSCRFPKTLCVLLLSRSHKRSRVFRFLIFWWITSVLVKGERNAPVRVFRAYLLLRNGCAVKTSHSWSLPALASSTPRSRADTNLPHRDFKLIFGKNCGPTWREKNNNGGEVVLQMFPEHTAIWTWGQIHALCDQLRPHFPVFWRRTLGL